MSYNLLFQKKVLYNYNEYLLEVSVLVNWMWYCYYVLSSLVFSAFDEIDESKSTTTNQDERTIPGTTCALVAAIGVGPEQVSLFETSK